MSCLEPVIDQLRVSGHRLTPQRVMVLDAIYHAGGHLTTDEVYERVQTHSRYVDRTTIYRTLQFLKQNGLIGEFRLDGQPVRYEAIRSGEEHHHAVCDECGQVSDIEPNVLEGLAEKLREDYGFHARLSHITIHGLCRTCAAKKQRS
ncbi:MAG: Fur family transcriptional regulator [Chloroflexota bacterium]|nr:Fur family transcriptional regulator [Chloroflexota bacterium]